MTSTVEPQKAEQVQQWIRDAAQAIDQYKYNGQGYAKWCRAEAEMEAKRPLLKDQIKKRLIEATPSLSATRADEQVRIEPEYLEYLENQRAAVMEKDLLHSIMTSARLQAELAIAAVKAIAGVL